MPEEFAQDFKLVGQEVAVALLTRWLGAKRPEKSNFLDASGFCGVLRIRSLTISQVIGGGNPAICLPELEDEQRDRRLGLKVPPRDNWSSPGFTKLLVAL